MIIVDPKTNKITGWENPAGNSNTLDLGKIIRDVVKDELDKRLSDIQQQLHYISDRLPDTEVEEIDDEDEDWEVVDELDSETSDTKGVK